MIDSSGLKCSIGRWSIPIALFLGSLLIVAATLKDYGVTWDEPPYYYAADLHIQWFSNLARNLVHGEIEKSLSDENIKAAWHWDPYHVPHPPFSRIVSGWTHLLFASHMDKFSAYRMGPALFFALLVAVMYLWMSELFDRTAALFSALALVLTPNLFGFAHIAVTDLPLATLWFLTVYCFWKGLTSWKWSVALGVTWGLALATKFPALLILIPLVLWAHLFHRDKYANNIFAMLFLAPLVMIASQPYLWHQPAVRILEFLHEGLSRGYRPETNFSIFFLNRLYYTAALPWYYPFFIVGVTTPEVILVLAIVGICRIPWLREQRSTIILFAINAFFIVCLGLAPGAVLHDGVRQLLSALPFLVGLAGGGFYFLYCWVVCGCRHTSILQRIEHLRPKAVGAVLTLFLFSPLLNLWLCHPFELSHYNHLVGGVRGAYRRGLEVTYFMEAFTPSFLRSLNEKLPANSVINASFANSMFAYYQQEGRLRRDIKITDTRAFNYLILLNRRSILPPRERLLVNGPVQPYLSVRIAGVPIVSVFEFKKPG